MAIATNNEMSSFGMASHESKDKAPEHKMKAELGHRKFNIEGGDAEIFLSLNGIVVMNKANGLTVDEYGTSLDGKISLGRPPSDLRIGGFWIFNDKLMTCLPSTNYTPLPTLVFKEPPNVKYIQKIVGLISSLG
jgi:hypothetical protein